MLETRGVMEQAEALFATRPAWTRFYRELLGPEGLVPSVYTDAELDEFEESEAYTRIQEMIAELRARDASVEAAPREPTKVITVRLPSSLHRRLKDEAHRHQTSVNQLCITKLLAPLLATVKVHEQPAAATENAP